MYQFEKLKLYTESHIIKIKNNTQIGGNCKVPENKTIGLHGCYELPS